MAQRRKRNPSKLAGKLVLFCIVTAVLALSLFWQHDINRALGLTSVEYGDYAGTNATVIRADGGDLVVHFIDVGQGDASVIELPDGRNVLVDAGSGKSKQQLLTYLDENFSFDKFDFVILTHSDEDHAGGIADVLARFSVGTFYRPNELSTKAPFVDPDANAIVGSGKKNTEAYRKAIEAAHRASDEVVVTYLPTLKSAGADKIVPSGKAADDVGYYEITFFGPSGHSYKNVNDFSPILLVEYEGKRIMLSGDAEAQAEAEFVQHAAAKTDARFARFTDSFTVDVIKLGHHGSKTSSSRDYLNTLTTPTSVQDVLVVISCGLNNSYRHPHSEVLTRLSDLGFSEGNILRTDQNGSIVLAVRFDPEQSTFQLYYGASAHNVARNAPLSWLQIAIGLWVLAIIVIFGAGRFLATAPSKSKKRNRKKRR